MAKYGWLGLLTDYGLADGFVAACHGVLARLAPDLRVIDLTHLVPPGDVRRGATVLAQTVGSLPPAVILAVVDPGVGTARRPVALRAGPSLLVGPDNGLLPSAADALGGPQAAVVLTEDRFWRHPVSATFHGRDVFAPVAARLATGTPLARLGSPLAVADLVRLPEPKTRAAPGRIESEVLTVDRFGNLQLVAGSADLAAAGIGLGATLRVAGRQGVRPVRVGRTFADVPPGELVAHLDSADRLALAVNAGSAAEVLGLVAGDAVLLVALRPTASA